MTTANENAPIWDKEGALARLMNKQALLDALLSMFKSQAPGQFDTMMELAQLGNWSQLKLDAHSLKGAALAIGAAALGDSLAQLERAAAAEQQDVIEQLIAQSEIDLYQFLNLIE